MGIDVAGGMIFEIFTGKRTVGILTVETGDLASFERGIFHTGEFNSALIPGGKSPQNGHRLHERV